MNVCRELLEAFQNDAASASLVFSSGDCAVVLSKTLQRYVHMVIFAGLRKKTQHFCFYDNAI